MDIRASISDVMAIKNHLDTDGSAEQEVINVSAATKRVAYAYERFRNTLEPDEEDILRRRAIYRILKRRLPEDDQDLTIRAEQLLQELIRANYISPVPKLFSQALGKKMARAQDIYDGLDESLKDWFLQIMAVAIDREIFPRNQEEAFVQMMYKDTWLRAQWLDDLVTAQDRPTQLYIGCHRALFEADDYEISWHYFTRHFPAWEAAELAEVDRRQIQQNLPKFYATITQAVHYPVRNQIMRVLRPAAVPYRITRDILISKELAFNDDEQLAESTRRALGQRAQKVRGRMNKRAWNSILFLFLTKTILALAVEVPYEKIVLGEFHQAALVVNILFHPLLLFFAATTARLPGARNTQVVVDQVKVIISGQGELPTLIFRPTRSYGPLTWTLFALVYVVLFLLLFWGVFFFLSILDFSLVAMLMFLMFLGLVTFLSTRIRRSVQEISVVSRREGLFGSIISFITLPVIEFGRWLAMQVSKVNVPLILMDRVLEAPFKIFIDVLEEWFSFIRDRKEEIV